MCYYDKNVATFLWQKYHVCTRERNSLRRWSVRKGVLRSFTKFIGKRMCQSIRPTNLFKKRPWHRCFPSKFVTEMLIFRSSSSQMFFKTGVLKNFTIQDLFLIIKLQDFSLHIRWVLLKFCVNKYFLAAEYGIYCWKSNRFLSWTQYELNLRSSHWSCSVKRCS